jgi:16S rRNA (adenine1518-N6/adenine1519-N6)-dimethyltransferase
MLTKNDIKALEKKYGFSPQKKFGQNFLIDPNIRNKILRYANVCEDDILLEIGSGLGQLTFELSRIVKKLIAVEFDKKLFLILSDFAKDFTNIVLVHDDFLKFNFKDFISKNQKIKVISNLPFYIGTPVILKLFVNSEHIDSAMLTLQKEVADRLVAEPGGKEYSSLTLHVEFHSEVKRLFDIKKNSFYPKPKVDSTVIFLKMRESPPVKVRNKEDLFDLIRAGFSMRRKTLLNAISSKGYKGLSKKELENVLKTAGIPNNTRAETLRLSDFAKIMDSI